MTAPNRLVISEIMSGLQDYEKPFFINNDSFPILENAICWRKSVRKKQGSSFLGQLRRQVGITGASPFTVTLSPIPLQHGTSMFSIGAVVLVDGDITGGNIATLTSSNVAYSGTLDRSTGLLTINHPVIAPTAVYFYPGIPALGIEQFESDKSPNTQIDFPINVFFDQVYSYQFDGTNFYDVSFYKGTKHPVYWTGANYQQFDSTNYYRAMFETNNVPGFHFLSGTYTSGSPGTAITFNFKDGVANFTTLELGDILFFNEWPAGDTVNFSSGTVTDITGAAGGNYVVTFASSVTASGTGIVQLMTDLVPGHGDGIRWYDGDPAFFQGDSGSPSGLGWVNFAPPLDNLQSSSTTYLMGARIVIPFGNRLLAIGTYEDTSANFATPRYFGNRIRFCEVSATPFYALPVPATNPPNSFEPNAWVSNIQGFGGFIDLDTTQRIISAAITQGSLVLGLEREQRRMSNTGIETDPFSLQTINPEYGTAGTFAVIPMDKGILTAGEYGFMTTSSYDSQRFDQKIIDQIFQITQDNNGYERICGARDYVNEVIYFTYASDNANENNVFPDQTVVFNYREGSFGLWDETFTTYGTYKNSTSQTWATYFTPWENWEENWEDLGADRFSKPFVAGGTPQGFILLKWSENSYNEPSMYIHAIVNNGDGTYTITSNNHNLEDGLYLGFWPGDPSTSVGIQSFNGFVDSIVSTNQFIVTFAPNATPGSIVPGIWQMSIVDQLDIWTKQFQLAWSGNRKTRIGAQKYFLDTTTLGEFTVNIYGSQSTVSLDSPTSPSAISSNIVRTRPDDSLGLNDSANLQTQIWHRLASSAIGDTVQLEFTFSNDQMLDVDISTSPWVLYSTILDLYPSRTLA